jgi:hypothetical protein
VKRSYIILIIGASLIIADLSLSVVDTRMWWSIPSEPPTMRPVVGFDYIMLTLQPILPTIGFTGILVLVIGIGLFFMDRKKIR